MDMLLLGWKMQRNQLILNYWSAEYQNSQCTNQYYCKNSLVNSNITIISVNKILKYLICDMTTFFSASVSILNINLNII